MDALYTVFFFPLEEGTVPRFGSVVMEFLRYSCCSFAGLFSYVHIYIGTHVCVCLQPYALYLMILMLHPCFIDMNAAFIWRAGDSLHLSCFITTKLNSGTIKQSLQCTCSPSGLIVFCFKISCNFLIFSFKGYSLDFTLGTVFLWPRCKLCCANAISFDLGHSSLWSTACVWLRIGLLLELEWLRS